MTYFDCLLEHYKEEEEITLHNYIENLLDFWIELSFSDYIEIENKNRPYSVLSK